MISAIQSALDNVLGHAATLKNASGAGRAFELLIMSGIALELRVRGYDVWLQRSDGTRIAPSDPDLRFIQRGGRPTGISGAGQGPGHASVIGFGMIGRPNWEIWNGIQFRGRSRARHEIDLAIVPASVGNALRALPTGGVPLGRPRVSIECKDVTAAGTVDEMRAFVARLYDLTLLEAHYPYLAVSEPPMVLYPASPNEGRHRPTTTYWNENQRTLNILARRTTFSVGSADLSQHYCIAPYSNIEATGRDIDGLIDDIVSWIVHQGY